MLLSELIEELESHIWEENEELEIHFVLNTEDDKEDDIDLELAGTTRTDYSDKTIVYIDLMAEDKKQLNLQGMVEDIINKKDSKRAVELISTLEDYIEDLETAFNIDCY